MICKHGREILQLGLQCPDCVKDAQQMIADAINALCEKYGMPAQQSKGEQG